MSKAMQQVKECWLASPAIYFHKQDLLGDRWSLWLSSDVGWGQQKGVPAFTWPADPFHCEQSGKKAGLHRLLQRTFFIGLSYYHADFLGIFKWDLDGFKLYERWKMVHPKSYTWSTAKAPSIGGHGLGATIDILFNLIFSYFERIFLHNNCPRSWARACEPSLSTWSVIISSSMNSIPPCYTQTSLWSGPPICCYNRANLCLKQKDQFLWELYIFPKSHFKNIFVFHFPFAYEVFFQIGVFRSKTELRRSVYLQIQMGLKGSQVL